MDVLSPVLDTLRLSAGRYCCSELSVPWGIRFLERRCAMFHVVDRGSLWLRVEGESAPLALSGGDLVLLPHGTEHSLSDSVNRGARVVEFRDDHRFVVDSRDKDGPRTRFVCGEIHLEEMVAHPLLVHLPRVMHIRSDSDVPVESLQLTLRALGVEASRDEPGVESVITRLTEVLFVQALRAWLRTNSAIDTGWLAGLTDPSIAKALALIHRQPAAPWTVASLAEEVGMSRSVFARRFGELVGEAPIAYLTRWRMYLAATTLRDHPHAAIAEVAESSGYDSAAAFNRAFRKVIGTTPGQWRRSTGTAVVPEAASAAS